MKLQLFLSVLLVIGCQSYILKQPEYSQNMQELPINTEFLGTPVSQNQPYVVNLKGNPESQYGKTRRNMENSDSLHGTSAAVVSFETFPNGKTKTNLVAKSEIAEKKAMFGALLSFIGLAL
ncbi:unnamed protein product [Orchesella dallaii]|uniref:Uncharacterized protein n=1 Tax=Orchesella dallaii TaxID=48710 RepID=A0ABP1RJE6_9HEXA